MKNVCEVYVQEGLYWYGKQVPTVVAFFSLAYTTITTFFEMLNLIEIVGVVLDLDI